MPCTFPYILLMAEIRRAPVEVGSLSLFYPIIFRVLYIPGGFLAGFQPSTVIVLYILSHPIDGEGTIILEQGGILQDSWGSWRS